MLNHLPTDGRTSLLVVAAVLSVTWWTLRGARRLRRGQGGKRGTPAVWAASVAAAGCTAYSADTSWGFAADYLDMSGTVERAAMFGAAELALFATALMARQNLNGPNRAPGAPGGLVWLITGVQIIPAYAESGAVGGTVRAFVGPVMAAVLWHLAMGIELRHRKPDAASRGVAAMVGRELREWLLSRLGVVERTRDAAQITRDRATVRAVALAAALADKTPEQRGKRAGRRTARRLAVAVARASVGTDRGQRRDLLDQLAARRHAAALATIDLPSPWAEPALVPEASALAVNTREQMRHATETIRQQRPAPQLLFADIARGQAVNKEGRSPEHRPGSGWQPTTTAVPAQPAEVKIDNASSTDALNSSRSPERGPDPTSPATAAGQPTKLSAAEARSAIEEGWAQGLSVRDAAKRATRAPSYVHGVFVKLGEMRGSRPATGQADADSAPDVPEAKASAEATEAAGAGTTAAKTLR